MAKVVIVGAGAIGGYIGAQMVKAGIDLTFVDPWPEHVEAMQRDGLRAYSITDTEDSTVPVRAMHVCDLQSLAKGSRIDVAFIAVKSYDTVWATMLIAPYLAEHGCAVSLQNCINEEQIAGVVGEGKTLGVVIPLLGAELEKPGQVKRTRKKGGSEQINFRVGELHGRVTKRAEEIAEMLRAADSAKVTTNLWGERWSKLVINSMRNGLSAVTGIGSKRDLHDDLRAIAIRLGSEAVRVGQALGYELEEMAKVTPETLALAGEGDKDALAAVTESMIREATSRSAEQRPSMAQDIAKGRRTETDFINGFVALKGDQVGVPAPTHAKLNELVKRVERGEITPEIAAVKELIPKVPAGV